MAALPRLVPPMASGALAQTPYSMCTLPRALPSRNHPPRRRRPRGLPPPPPYLGRRREPLPSGKGALPKAPSHGRQRSKRRHQSSRGPQRSKGRPQKVNRQCDKASQFANSDEILGWQILFLRGREAAASCCTLLNICLRRNAKRSGEHQHPNHPRILP